MILDFPEVLIFLCSETERDQCQSVHTVVGEENRKLRNKEVGTCIVAFSHQKLFLQIIIFSVLRHFYLRDSPKFTLL